MSFYSTIDGYLFVSSYTNFSMLWQQANINPVYPLLFFYYIIDGYLSINNYTTFSLFNLQASIKPVNLSLFFNFYFGVI